jgi:hypothetical protein
VSSIATAGTGNLVIKGLPFSVAADIDALSIIRTSLVNWDSDTAFISAYVSGSTINFAVNKINGLVPVIKITMITVLTELGVSGCYLTNS